MDSIITLSIMFAYVLLLVSIGIISSRKIKNYDGFFLADRSLKTFPLLSTLTATTVGGSATIVAGGRIYAQGLPALTYDLAGGLGLIVLGLFLASKVRKTGLYTLPDITGSLFNKNVRHASAILIVITEIAWVSLLIQACSLVLSVALPIDFTQILIIMTILFISYTILGGQYAVVFTDIIQFIVMLIGICILAAPLLFFEALPNIGQLTSTTLSFPVNEHIGFISVTSIFFMMFLPHVVGPDIYSKILSAKNETIAKKGAILSGIFKLIFAIAIAIIALSAIILFPNMSEPIKAIPVAIFNLSPFIAGFVLAAFISVMLSSSDSCLLSAGTIISVDILKNKNFNITRAGILLVGLSALALALYLNDVLKTLELAYTIFTAGLTIPILFGFYKKKTRVNATGALLGLILGGGISLIWFFLNNPFQIDAIIIGMICSIIPLLLFRDAKNEKSYP
jgi:solute:Na+ symporter, SSS family